MIVQQHSERHDKGLISVVNDCLEDMGGSPDGFDRISPSAQSLSLAKTYDGRTDACSFVAVQMMHGAEGGYDLKVIGHAYVFPCEELEGDMALGIHVMRPWQRKKIGHALVQRVLEWVVEKKHAFIRMTTLKTNLRSQAFFASMGFEVENHFTWKDGNMIPREMGPHVYMRWTAPVVGAEIPR